MTLTLEKFLKAAGNVGRAKQIDDFRKRVYELSKGLETDEGYQLMKEFDAAIETVKRIEKDRAEATKEDSE